MVSFQNKDRLFSAVLPTKSATILGYSVHRDILIHLYVVPRSPAIICTLRF